MPRTRSQAANPSPRQICQAAWSSSLVKARSKRDAWGCLIAEDRKQNKNSNIKVILFPKQIKKFLVGTDDSKVHFNLMDDDIGKFIP